ncbi:MAG TPA: 4-(cytidine 5'-diphospho)-2-C-methyl-D-erythritol kinase, partial [Armatimonadota bacterium]
MMKSRNAHTIHSYAKVNLSLDVLGTRPDGFHAIDSVMQTISLHDTISIEIEDTTGIRVSCDVAGIPTDESNLAWKAADIVLRNYGVSAGLH